MLKDTNIVHKRHGFPPYRRNGFKFVQMGRMTSPSRIAKGGCVPNTFNAQEMWRVNLRSVRRRICLVSPPRRGSSPWKCLSSPHSGRDATPRDQHPTPSLAPGTAQPRSVKPQRGGNCCRHICAGTRSTVHAAPPCFTVLPAKKKNRRHLLPAKLNQATDKSERYKYTQKKARLEKRWRCEQKQTPYNLPGFSPGGTRCGSNRGRSAPRGGRA